MSIWEKACKSIPYDWLLEDENPSVKYFTLRDLLGVESNNPELQNAKKAIIQTGVIPKILAKQHPEGYWGKSSDFYVYSKYKGTSWTLLILAQLGADGQDTRIHKSCEFILHAAQDISSGAFAFRSNLSGSGNHNDIGPCFTGNMVWMLIRFDYSKDPRIQNALKWITTYQRFDDGETHPPRSWPYLRRDNCWGRHTCHASVVCSLKALSAIPKADRTIKMNEVANQGAEHLLKHHIFRRSHDLSQIAMPDWLQLAFPIMVTSDIIDILEILLNLGVRDERMQESINLILAKQQADGSWLLERSHIGRHQAGFGALNQPNKYVTLRAARIIRKYFNTG